MGKGNRSRKSPWLKLKQHKPGYYYSLIVLIFLGVLVSIGASLFLSRVVQIPESWYEFMGLDLEQTKEGQFLTPEPPITETVIVTQALDYLFVDMNYPDQVVLNDREVFAVQVILTDHTGAAENLDVALDLQTPEGQVLFSQTAQSDGFGQVKFSVPLQEGMAGLLRGQVMVGQRIFPVEIQVSQQVDVMERDTDGDGLSDVVEVAQGLDFRNPDPDGDGLNDKVELDVGTNPREDNLVVFSVLAGEIRDFKEPNASGTVNFRIDIPGSYRMYWVEELTYNYRVFFEGFVKVEAFSPESGTLLKDAEIYSGMDLQNLMFTLRTEAVPDIVSQGEGFFAVRIYANLNKDVFNNLRAIE